MSNDIFSELTRARAIAQCAVWQCRQLADLGNLLLGVPVLTLCFCIRILRAESMAVFTSPTLRTRAEQCALCHLRRLF